MWPGRACLHVRRHRPDRRHARASRRPPSRDPARARRPRIITVPSDLGTSCSNSLMSSARVGARQHDPGLGRRFTPLMTAQTVARVVALRAPLRARQHRLAIADLIDLAGLEALDRRADDLAEPLVVFPKMFSRSASRTFWKITCLTSARRAPSVGRLRTRSPCPWLLRRRAAAPPERTSSAGRSDLDNLLDREEVDCPDSWLEAGLQVLGRLVGLASDQHGVFDRRDDDRRLDALFLSDRLDQLLQRLIALSGCL